MRNVLKRVVSRCLQADIVVVDGRSIDSKLWAVLCPSSPDEMQREGQSIERMPPCKLFGNSV